MEPKYLQLNLCDKTIYFSVTIKKKFRYFARGIRFHDYNIIINEIYFYEKDYILDNINDGFLCIDRNNDIQIYNNMNKTYFKIDNYDDILGVCYVYNNKFYTTLNETVKEILYSIFVFKS